LQPHAAADLQDIGDLEGYVRATGVMLFFLSKDYFTSRNCLREVKATIHEQLPLVLVHEQQKEKGGGPLEMMQTECREELRPYVFDERAPITWHRIAHYQNLTLKLIATEMLQHGPKYNDSLHNSSSQLAHFIATAHPHSKRNASTREELTPSERMSRKSSLVKWLGVQAAKAPAMQEQEAAAAVKVQAIVRGNTTRQMSPGALIPRKELSLVLPGEVNIAKLALPRPLVLWCSTGNPGAAAMAHELNDALAGGGDAIQVVERRPDMRVLEAQGKSVAMLLYLNKDTWAAQPGVLEHDVRTTHSFAHGLGAGMVRMASNMQKLRRMGSSLDERGAGAVSADKIRIVLVHEADPAKGGCEFGTFFGTTPQGLIDEGIYKDIAIALHTPPHRVVSLALVAQALGATKDAARLAARRGKAKASTTTPKPVSADPEAQTEESRMGQAAASAFASAPAATKSVELVRTPIGLGLTVDSHYKVLAIAKGSQAKRNRGIAVGDQLVSINDVPLSGGGSFDEQLGAIAVGTKVRLVISKPAGRRSGS